MSCSVYFLYSELAKKFYVGITNDVAVRVHRHNNFESLSIRYGVPWKLIYVIECEGKLLAMILENKILTRGIGRYLKDHNITPEL